MSQVLATAMVLRSGVLLCAMLLSIHPSRAADPMRVYAAGSLSSVLPKLIAAAGLPKGSVAPPVFGPAGLLRQRLQGGEHADLFASADLGQAEAVAQGADVMVVPFVRNRMCVAAPEWLGLTADTLLDRLLSPELRLATSTPGADPGGDYALAVFARSEALHPGAEAVLQAKALMLVGGPGSPAPLTGRSATGSVFLGNRADALLYYCSGGAALKQEVPALASIPLPEALEVHPVYAMAVSTSRPEAMQLALFMLSTRGQAILQQAGFEPLVPMRTVLTLYRSTQSP